MTVKDIANFVWANYNNTTREVNPALQFYFYFSESTIKGPLLRIKGEKLSNLKIAFCPAKISIVLDILFWQIFYSGFKRQAGCWF